METHHSFQAIDSKTIASSVVAQMDASDLNSRGDDDRNTSVNGWGSARDCDAQRDSSLARTVGVLILLSHSSTGNCYIQHPSALLSGNISKSLSSVSNLISSSTRTLFPLS